jgi:hypothetical protein
MDVSLLDEGEAYRNYSASGNGGSKKSSPLRGWILER